MSEQAIRFAGDVKIDKVKIITRSGNSQDITGQVIRIQIFEDIFNPFMTGSLIIKESLDFINVLPFSGEEELEMEISTPAFDKATIKGIFYIYKLTDRELLGDRSVVYQLHFISSEAIIDLNKKLSKVYTGNVGDVVKDLVTNKVDGLQSEKTLTIEPTARSCKFISNFWSPVKSINYASSFAENKNNSPSYLFFENREGFYFISLETLYGNAVYQELIYDRYTRDKLPMGADIRDVKEDYKRISDLSIPTGFDYIDRIRSGLFASKVISYDITKKSYNVKNYNMFDVFDKQTHLNKYNIGTTNSIFRTNSLIINLPRDNANFSGYGDATTYKNIQKRLSLLKAAETNKITVTVPGRFDYTVGQKFKVTLNKMEPIRKEDTDITDKMFSGNYIVSAINHDINREMHECHMELIKDSLLMSVDKAVK
jgi:hypothetical protein